MPQQKTEYLALLSAPGGLEADKEAVKNAVSEINDSMQHERVSVFLKDWKTDIVPGKAKDAQSLINEQIVDSSDIVIALVHTRMGTATPRASSGTVEEVERFIARHDAGENVGIFVAFKKEHVDPDQIDIDQLQKVRSFKSQLQAMSVVYFDYDDIPSLSKDVRTRLPGLVRQMQNARDGEIFSSAEKLEIDQSSFAFWSADEEDDDDVETGALDSQIQFEEGMGSLTAGMERMTAASESFQVRVTGALSSFGDNPSALTTKERQKAVNSVAKVLSAFADDLEQSLAEMKVGKKTAESAFTGLSSHFGGAVDASPDELGALASVVETARASLAEVIPTVVAAREGIGGFPTLTAELRKARVRTVKLIDGVINLLTDMVEWFDATALQLRKLEKTAEDGL